MPNDPVRVDIYGTIYTIKGEGSPEEVREVARHVDRIMRETAQESGVTDSLKVAVLAALQIADDYQRLKRELGELETSVSGTTQHCVSLLDEFLDAMSSARS
ncbi:MAG: cell division protein ZapA [Acidobacteriota bacterium]